MPEGDETAEQKKIKATKVREFHFAKIRRKRRARHADPEQEESDEEPAEPAEKLSNLSDRVKELLCQPSVSSVSDRRQAYADARTRISEKKTQSKWANVKGATRGKQIVQGLCGAIRGQVRGRNVAASWLGAIRAGGAGGGLGGGGAARPEQDQAQTEEDDDDGFKAYHGVGVINMVKICEELTELGEPKFVNEVQGCIEELKDTETALSDLKTSLVNSLGTMDGVSTHIEDSVALARERIARFDAHVHKARRRMTRQLTRRRTTRRLSNLNFEGQRARTPTLMDEVSEQHVGVGEHASGPQQKDTESHVPQMDLETDDIVDNHVQKLTEVLCDSMTRLEDQILSNYRLEIQPLIDELGIEAPEFLQPDRQSRAPSNSGSRVQTASLHGSRAPTASSQHRPRSRVSFQDEVEAVVHLDDLSSLSTEGLHAQGIRSAEVAGIRDSEYAPGSHVEDMNAASSRHPGVVDFVEGSASAESAYVAAAINEILQQLKMPDSEGRIRIEDWNQRYNHHLGSLQSFLQSRPDVFEAVLGENGDTECRVKLAAGASRFVEAAWECESGQDPYHTESTSPADDRESTGRGFYRMQSAREILPGIIVYNGPLSEVGQADASSPPSRSSPASRPGMGRILQKRHGMPRNEPLPILEVVAAASRPSDETDPRSVLEKAAAIGQGSENESQVLRIDAHAPRDDATPAPQDHLAFGSHDVDTANEGVEDEIVFTNLGADIDVGSDPLVAEGGIAPKKDSNFAFRTQPSALAFGTQSTALPSPNGFLAPFSASATNFEWFGLGESRSESFLHGATVKDYFKNGKMDKTTLQSGWSKTNYLARTLPEVPPTRGGWPVVRGTPAEKTRTRLMKTQTGDDVFLPPLPQTPPRTAVVETMSQHTVEAVKLDRRRLAALKSHPSRAAQPRVNFPKKPWEQHNTRKPAQPFGGPALLRVGRSARSPVPRRGAPDMHQSTSLPQLPNGLGLHHLSAWRKSLNCAPKRSPRAKH